MTPQSEGGTRIPREGAQSGVEINGCRQRREQQWASLDPNPRWLAGSQAATYRGLVRGAGAGQPQRACRRILWSSTLGKERTPESLSTSDETGRLSLSIICQSSFSHNKHMNVLNNSNNTDISRVTLQEVINITSLLRIFLNPFPTLLPTHIRVYTNLYFVCRNEVICINLLYSLNIMSWRAFQVSIFFSF